MICWPISRRHWADAGKDGPMLKLCRLDDLVVGKARLLNAGHNHLILVRSQANAVQAYLNRCPHLKIPLASQDSQLMSPDGSAIQCATHGALFIPESGFCISGPCKGEQLWSFTCLVENASVYLDETELPNLPTEN
jgi:hypothetical protein